MEVVRRLSSWLIRDIWRSLSIARASRTGDTVHILFCFVDHFEPGNRNAPFEQQRQRVDWWVEDYPRLAARHSDADGLPPCHSFFFPPHYDTADHLERIVALCGKGYGEVEMHLHHDRMPPWPDSAVTLRHKIQRCIDDFSGRGVFCLPGGARRYGFIHGDWALGNSLAGGRHCGVNEEIALLRQTGCYADFTFPAACEAQPGCANTFFYTTGPPIPKGYDHRPQPARAGKGRGDGLLLIQGPIGIRWHSRTHRFRPSIEQSNIDRRDLPLPARIDYWIKKNIHVAGRPEWIFVKIHTHGAREEDRDVLLGEPCHRMFSYLETRYNDGETYRLHYVSAREMYNIIRAAEDGLAGDPGLYRDYDIPRYLYLPER